MTCDGAEGFSKEFQKDVRYVCGFWCEFDKFFL